MITLQTSETRKIKAVVTFTFIDSKNLGNNFVEALKEKYQEKNVIYIDQSTYGIDGQEVDTKDILGVLLNAEEKGEKCKDGDTLTLINVEKSKRLILTRSLIFETRLEQMDK